MLQDHLPRPGSVGVELGGGELFFEAVYAALGCVYLALHGDQPGGEHVLLPAHARAHPAARFFRAVFDVQAPVRAVVVVATGIARELAVI